MSGHTKEPWRVTADGFIASSGFVPVRTPFREDAFKPGPGRSDHSDELLGANARRIVACVNACAGIAIEMLETMATDPLGGAKYWIRALADVSRERERLNTENAALNDYCAAVEQQRDRLLEAVRGLLDALPSATTHPAIATARSAIAEVEGSGHEPV